MKKRMGKKASNILSENIIFLILNVAFFSILVIFLMRQGGGAVLDEELYAKQIALLIDNARPGMTIMMDFSDAIEIAEKNKIETDKVVSINKNAVKIKLSEKSGYSYTFFNNFEANAYLNENKLVIKIK